MKTLSPQQKHEKLSILSPLLQPKMDFIDRVMTDLIKTVVKYAPIALETPDNYEARANLMWASSWALNGFVAAGIDQDVSCHMMEHELSAFYDITHGLGLAILAPRWLKYVLDRAPSPNSALMTAISP